MDPRFKHRLVGVITLALFIVIFLPVLLDKKAKNVESSVPLVAQEHSSNSAIVEENDDIIDINPIHHQSVNEGDEENSQNQINSIIETEKQYLVQLVTLRSARQIERLVALLILNNFSVLTKPDKPKEGQLNVLYVGPYASKQDATKDLGTLKKLTELSGKIIVNNIKR